MSNKVTAVQNNGTYQGSYGLMYKQEVTLDDGTTGEVSAKSENKWKVGDIVEVQRTETQYGTRFRFSIPEKPSGAAGTSSSYDDPDKIMRIEASWAIGQAVAMGAKKHEELVSNALGLLDARNAVVAALKATPAAPVNIPPVKPEPKPEDVWGATLGDNPIY